jgi:small subunit ribosomal protein S20
VPNLKSSKKQMRQAAKRRIVNRVQRSSVRTALKKVRQATNAQQAEAAFRAAERELDRAARKGLVNKNTAARNKQRLRKLIAKLAS